MRWKNLYYILRIFFMSMSTSYVRTHIYIEDMCTKKALSAWIPLVSVFCSSGVVSGIRGKQMLSAVASERSIFSKNHDYNSSIKSFPCRGEHVRTYISGYRCTQWQKTRNKHTRTRRTATVMIIRLFEALQLNRYNTTYTYAKPLNIKPMH